MRTVPADDRRGLAPGGHLRVDRGRRGGGGVAGGGLDGRGGNLGRLVRHGSRVVAPADRRALDGDALEALGGHRLEAGGDQVFDVHDVPGGVGEDALLVVVRLAGLQALDEHDALDRAVAEVDRERSVGQHALGGHSERAVRVEGAQGAVTDRRTGRGEGVAGGGGGVGLRAADGEEEDDEGKTHGRISSGGTDQPGRRCGGQGVLVFQGRSGFAAKKPGHRENSMTRNNTRK